MVFRNPEVRRASAIAVLLGGACAALTGFLVARADASAAPTVAAAGCVAAAVCALVPLLVATRARYRAISRMSDRLDAVLNGGRSLDFRSIGEGELSILSSELDRVITRLDATVEELEREKRALADALADISHQLKTPLTSIALSTELIRTRLAEAEASPDLIERVRLVQRLQGRVEELVATLLKLARIDAGVVKLTRIPVRAGALVDAATEALAIAFDIAGVQLELDVDQKASFTGDPNWSAEALGNVLKNCLEHTGAGGQVRIRAWEGCPGLPPARHRHRRRHRRCGPAAYLRALLPRPGAGGRIIRGEPRRHRHRALAGQKPCGRSRRLAVRLQPNRRDGRGYRRAVRLRLLQSRRLMPGGPPSSRMGCRPGPRLAAATPRPGQLARGSAPPPALCAPGSTSTPHTPAGRMPRALA